MGRDYRLNQFSLPENMSVAMVIVHRNKDLNRALCQTVQVFQINLPAFKLAVDLNGRMCISVVALAISFGLFSVKS